MSVSVSIDGAIAEVRLGRPQRHNALNPAMLAALAAAAAEVRRGGCLVMLLHGAGPSFCSGADTAALAALDGDDARRRWITVGHRAFEAVASSPAITVAALHGHVLGGGLELALRADLRIAAPTTRIGLPEVSIGGTPGWGGTDLLTRLVGESTARRLALTGLPIDAADLHPALVHEIDGDPLGRARALARHLIGLDPAAVRATKSLFPTLAATPEGVERDGRLLVDLA